MKLSIFKSVDGKLNVVQLDDLGRPSQLIQFNEPLCLTAAHVVLSCFQINPDRKDVEIEYFVTNETLSLAVNISKCSQIVFDQPNPEPH